MWSQVTQYDLLAYGPMTESLVIDLIKGYIWKNKNNIYKYICVYTYINPDESDDTWQPDPSDPVLAAEKKRAEASNHVLLEQTQPVLPAAADESEVWAVNRANSGVGQVPNDLSNDFSSWYWSEYSQITAAPVKRTRHKQFYNTTWRQDKQQRGRTSTVSNETLDVTRSWES